MVQTQTPPPNGHHHLQADLFCFDGSDKISKTSRQLGLKPASLNSTNRRAAGTLRARPGFAVCAEFLVDTTLLNAPELAESADLQCDIPWESCNQWTYFGQREKGVQSWSSSEKKQSTQCSSKPQNDLRTNTAVGKQY